LLRIADRYGGKYTILSGYRSLNKQFKLWEAQTSTPAAFPGCSQHNYGLAVDVSFTDNRWQRWFMGNAQKIGLQTVVGDRNHLQVLPGADFRRRAEGSGLCPDPAFDRLASRGRGIRGCPPGMHHVEIVGGNAWCSETGSSEEGFSIE